MKDISRKQKIFKQLNKTIKYRKKSIAHRIYRYTAVMLSGMLLLSLCSVFVVGAVNNNNNALIVNDQSVTVQSPKYASGDPIANAGGAYDGIPGTAVILDGSGSRDTSGGTTGLDYYQESVYSSVEDSTQDYSNNAENGAVGYAYESQDDLYSTTGSSTSENNPVGYAYESQDDLYSATLVSDSSNGYTGHIQLWEWSFGDGETGNGETVLHVYSDAGPYTVTLTVTDNSGNTDTDTTTVTINETLIADAHGPYAGEVGEDIAFYGSATGGLPPYTWQWDFEDGSNSTDQNPTHEFTDDGVYEVTLTVNDSEDNASNDTATVRISTTRSDNIPPEAVIANESYCRFLGGGIIFDGSGSSDENGTIISWNWDFGDGFTDEGEIVSHAYTQVENYTVSLTVTDNESATDTTTAKVMIVGSSTAYPTADANGSYFGHVDESIHFNGSKSNDPDGTITKYTWDFGDETEGFGVSPTHIYTTNGTFYVTLTVIDNDGLIDTNETFVVVTNENRYPSKPIITGPINGSVGVAYEYSIFSIDPDGDMVQYVIDWDDDTTTTPPFLPSGTTATTRHMWNSAGTYYVTAYAEDEYGAVSEIVNLTVVIIGEEKTGNMLLGQTGSNVGSSGEFGYEKILYLAIALIAAIGTVLLWYRRKTFGNKNMLCDVSQERNPQDSMDRLSVTQEPSYIAHASQFVAFKEESPTKSSIDIDLGMFCPT